MNIMIMNTSQESQSEELVAYTRSSCIRCMQKIPLVMGGEGDNRLENIRSKVGKIFQVKKLRKAVGSTPHRGP